MDWASIPRTGCSFTVLSGGEDADLWVFSVAFYYFIHKINLVAIRVAELTSVKGETLLSQVPLCAFFCACALEDEKDRSLLPVAGFSTSPIAELVFCGESDFPEEGRPEHCFFPTSLSSTHRMPLTWAM